MKHLLFQFHQDISFDQSNLNMITFEQRNETKNLCSFYIKHNCCIIIVLQITNYSLLLFESINLVFEKKTTIVYSFLMKFVKVDFLYSS